MVEVDYKDIPIDAIGRNVLEIGVSNRIMNSHLWDKISHGSYTGIDVVNRIPEKKHLRIIEQDIREYYFHPTDKFDTIISVQTFEHINLWDWAGLFEKLKAALLPGGKLIIVLPHNQQFKGYPNFPDILTIHDSSTQHIVFGITQKMLEFYLPGAEFYIRRNFFWRQDGCSLLWAIGRFVKRLIIRNFNPIRRNIYAIWTKEGGL